MSIRATAPPHVELVRRFVNTLDVEDGTDALADTAGTAGWLGEHGLLRAPAPVTAGDAELARRIRDALRAVITAHHDGASPAPEAVAALRAGAAAAPLVVAVQDDGSSRLEPATDDVPGALARILAAVHRATLDGTWTRLKICPRDDCLWAFYDASRNRSGKWCSMAVCGNRAKTQRFRERHG